MQCIWGNHGFFYGHYASLCYGSLSGHYPCCVPVPHSHTFEYIPKHCHIVSTLTPWCKCWHVYWPAATRFPLAHPMYLIWFVRRRTTQRNHDKSPDFTASLRPSEMLWSPTFLVSPHHSQDTPRQEREPGHCSIFRLKSDLYDPRFSMV